MPGHIKMGQRVYTFKVTFKDGTNVKIDAVDWDSIGHKVDIRYGDKAVKIERL